VTGPVATAVLVVAGLVAAGVHLWIFVLESVLFGRPGVLRMFEVGAEHAPAVRPWAFHQGVYNLLLAGGLLVGLAVGLGGQPVAGRLLVAVAAGSMVAAGVALMAFDPRRERLAGFATQCLPAGAALLAAIS
jgi:putative membrane protein